MSGASTIQWTDVTWGPTRGCSIVSEGCHRCYAMKQAHRFNKAGLAFDGYTKATKSGPQWTGKVSLVEKTLSWPLRYKGHPDAIKEGRPTRIFVNSMSDLFHESLNDWEILAVFAVMLANMLTPNHHIFQILTKRAPRMRAFVEWIRERGGWGKLIRSEEAREKLRPLIAKHGIRTEVVHPFGDSRLPGTIYRSSKDAWDMVMNAAACHMDSTPLYNVWLGVSCENQERADERIPDLLATPAAVRFVSAEPLLGPIRLDRPISTPDGSVWDAMARGALGWVIVGGESGPGARPCDVSWVRTIKDQCQAAEVPVFIKQFGARPTQRTIYGAAIGNEGAPVHDEPLRLKDKKGGDMAEWSEDLRVREMPR